MPSEYDIRTAIVGQITAALASFDPPPLVLDRDITGILQSGNYSGLLDEDNRIHVWVVTQRSMAPEDHKQSNGKLYQLAYNVTQIIQYRSGSNLSNSIKEASLERDAVIAAFAFSAALPAILKHQGIDPLEWPNNLIDKPEPITGGTARTSEAILRAYNFYGPVAC